MEKVEKIGILKRFIDESNSFAVVTHVHPDGDALGSSSAVYHYLRSIGKTNISVIHEAAPSTIDFICEGSPVINPEDSAEVIAAADLIICTDFNGMSRSGVAEDFLRAAKGRKVLLDHHLEPQIQEFDLVFSRPEISSASEMVWETLSRLGELPLRSLECLMAGMTTDTNNFANSVFPSTLKMAADLIAAGVDRDAIIAKLYNRHRENRVRAISYILSNHLTILDNGLAYILVSKETWHRFGLQEGELEGLVNIPLTIDKVKIVVYVRECENEPAKVSVRSKVGWSAQSLARSYFHGGGHECAAGGKLYIPQDVASFDEVGSFIEKLDL